MIRYLFVTLPSDNLINLFGCLFVCLYVKGIYIRTQNLQFVEIFFSILNFEISIKMIETFPGYYFCYFLTEFKMLSKNIHYLALI